ncbi:uncharacterized protein AMSG_01796 [Thecamonas trahens ATCC 50062]|uniref:EF-hand domain-containing protein n=1 Tax=Thecamonas trahens ATCC 50062 TaxID=461836 RepID=A0A0L0DVG7_THETB|nr:hypothetical protein AMSG_01796 [Thecamonas trahens ATCC 50062]KNC55533.1 hypothetical protein AMSG_01796 [Thecamonas trahens ATCC 50062]|eukprot:XP_013761307.1 hypothetical protein AMSG_01796 [Thecamonas trahens ATCC 50062]
MTSKAELVAALDESAQALFGAPAADVAGHAGLPHAASALGGASTDGSNTGAPEAMVSHRMDACKEYVARHKLHEIIQELSAQLLFHQPDDVRAFLIDRLQALAAVRDAAVSKLPAAAARVALFSEQDLDTVFDIYDVHNSGFISLDQYATAMADIGAVKFDPEPAAANNGRIDKKTFVYIANCALKDTIRHYAAASADAAE